MSAHTIPNGQLAPGPLEEGKGGDFVEGHPSGTFLLETKPKLNVDPNRITYESLSFPRTARIICDGTIYIKSSHMKRDWKDGEDIQASWFWLDGGNIQIQR